MSGFCKVLMQTLQNEHYKLIVSMAIVQNKGHGKSIG